MILALETSCDDTCAAVVTAGGEILSNVVSGQEAIHGEFQGVVPELASRRHCEVILTVLHRALEEANVRPADLDAVAVTREPGLIGSLLAGVAAAKVIAARHDLPLIPVNHIEAHAYSVELEHDVNPPYVSLVASGGHTALFEVRDETTYRLLGRTRDDAAGEAYDKVAKMMELGYPGGPEIERTARDGNPGAIAFPRPTLDGDRRWAWRCEELDFSFSGLKTAVYYHLRDHPDARPADVAASFQRALNDVLVHKTLIAAERAGPSRVCVTGGVAANGPLREAFREQGRRRDTTVRFPSPELCTDNAAMVGHRARAVDARADLTLNASPSNTVLEAASGEAAAAAT